MSEIEYWRQCDLRSGATVTTAWIEERGAHVGYTVTLHGEDGARRWTVERVGIHRATTLEVAGMGKQARDFKNDGSICNA